MANTEGISIDLGQAFPHLEYAPIVEAVIDFRAAADATWNEASVASRLRDTLPGYPTIKNISTFLIQGAFQMAPTSEPVAAASPVTQDRKWMGLRLESTDGKYVAQFQQTGFSLSRLKPYEDWPRFSWEALRLWSAHVAIAAPSVIQRLGVRFINRLEVPVANLNFAAYFAGMGSTPADLPSTGFLYQDSLAIPGYPYRVNVIRTIQPPATTNTASLTLLLDIDVLTTDEPVQLSGTTIESRLREMRWLKNHVFFGSLTEAALELCR